MISIRDIKIDEIDFKIDNIKGTQRISIRKAQLAIKSLEKEYLPIKSN